MLLPTVDHLQASLFQGTVTLRMVHRGPAVLDTAYLEAPHLVWELVWTLSMYTENVEYSTHMVDIRGHSISYNHWYYMYKRQIKYYKGQTTNQKTLCKTFADRAVQLHFVQTFLECNTQIHLRSPTRQIMQSLLQVKSVEGALHFNSSQQPRLATVSCWGVGIVLGAPHFITLSDRQLHDIYHWLTRFYPDKDFPRLAQAHTRVLHNNCYNLAPVYWKSEHVTTSDNDQPQEWVLQISAIIVYRPVYNQYYHFLDGNYYIADSPWGMEVVAWTTYEYNTPLPGCP